MIQTMLILFPQTLNSSHNESQLYNFEDNEAVIKMIIKGRSPTMRHVSRTHRVALDWLFDRINLDPKIQIKYIDTKNQLADILTKGNFTRDEWNILLHLCNISIFSSASCPETMSKRMQQGTGEERLVAKSKADVAPGFAFCGKLSCSAELECIQSPGDTQSTQSTRFESHGTMCWETSRWGSNQNDAVSSSQVWLTDAKTNDSPRKLAAAGTNHDLSVQACARKLAAENSEIIDDDSKWPHNISAYLKLTYHTLRMST